MRTAIAAAATAQTTINTGSTATGGVSGNMDTTPASGSIVLVMTPGSGATQNQYSKVAAFVVTSSTATAMTIASQSVGLGLSVGDFIFLVGTTSTLGPPLFENTLYCGLSTAEYSTTIAAGSNGVTMPISGGVLNVASTTGFPTSGVLYVDSSNGLQGITYTGVSGNTFTGCTGGTGTMATGGVVFAAPTSAVLLGAEPSATGGYARVAILNNPGNWPASSGSQPTLKSNGTAITFPASLAAWSTGATNLTLAFLADASTLGGGNVIAWAALTTPQAVNAASITPSFAATTLAWQLS